MAEPKVVGSVTYQSVDANYFVSGWNFGIASGGWGGLFIAAMIIAVMYLGLSFSLAEMSPALPHTGGAYSFARSTMGPWGGFVTGLAESIEYVMTPAVIAFFIGSFSRALRRTPTSVAGR
jgi:ethanolamine permease